MRLLLVRVLRLVIVAHHLRARRPCARVEVVRVDDDRDELHEARQVLGERARRARVREERDERAQRDAVLAEILRRGGRGAVRAPRVGLGWAGLGGGALGAAAAAHLLDRQRREHDGHDLLQRKLRE